MLPNNYNLLKTPLKVATRLGMRDFAKVAYIHVYLVYLWWYIRTFEHGGQAWREVNLRPRTLGGAGEIDTI
ncbi:MAG: hypothetical protein BA864_07430 [Desulfuromonadales bacterium C00003093]|nr:MAG: hypothetical protein BA864_07430 [Desulfuromonadales bacterium C00003093]